MTERLRPDLALQMTLEIQDWTSDNVVTCISRTNQVYPLITSLQRHGTITLTHNEEDRILTYMFQKSDYKVTVTRAIDNSLQMVEMPLFAFREFS